MHFRRTDGRNLDTVTIAMGLFDHNGNMIDGAVKIIDLRFKDENLGIRLSAGLSVEGEFRSTARKVRRPVSGERVRGTGDGGEKRRR